LALFRRRISTERSTGVTAGSLKKHRGEHGEITGSEKKGIATPQAVAATLFIARADECHLKFRYKLI
jgi:hypothetical protein